MPAIQLKNRNLNIHLGNDLFQLCNQFWQAFRSRQPNAFCQNFPVIMCQHVALPNDLQPGNFRMFDLEILGNVIGGFTNDHKLPLNRITQLIVLHKLGLGNILHKTQSFLAGGEQYPKGRINLVYGLAYITCAVARISRRRYGLRKAAFSTRSTGWLKRRSNSICI